MDHASRDSTTGPLTDWNGLIIDHDPRQLTSAYTSIRRDDSGRLSRSLFTESSTGHFRLNLRFSLHHSGDDLINLSFFTGRQLTLRGTGRPEVVA